MPTSTVQPQPVPVPTNFMLYIGLAIGALFFWSALKGLK